MKTIEQLTADLARVKTIALNKLTSMQAQANAEDRPLTPAERGAVDALFAEAKTIKAQLDSQQGDANLAGAIHNLTGGMATATDPRATPTGRGTGIGSLGDTFANDPQVREWIRAGGHRRSNSSSPPVEFMATTLTEGAGSGGALVIPDFRPDPIPLGQRTPVVAALFSPGQTTSNTVTFMREKTFTNAAAPTAEGALKPESALVYEQASAPVVKFAHFIPASTELLEDVPAMGATIDAKLLLGLALKIDDGLLNGTGVTPDVGGILTRPGLAPDHPRGTDSPIDAIKKAISQIYNVQYLVPDAVILNPNDLDNIQMLKDTQGRYLVPSLAWLKEFWNVRTIVRSPVTVAGTAVTGAFASGGAQVFYRGGPRLDASTSHQDYFVRNLVALLGEQRLALTVYREGAFGKITGL